MTGKMNYEYSQSCGCILLNESWSLWKLYFKNFLTTDVRQPRTNPQDSYFEYSIIRFDYLIIG